MSTQESPSKPPSARPMAPVVPSFDGWNPPSARPISVWRLAKPPPILLMRAERGPDCGHSFDADEMPKPAPSSSLFFCPRRLLNKIEAATAKLQRQRQL